MNIHDVARKLAASASVPLSTAYSRLARRRRRHYGTTPVKPGEFHHVETPRKIRLPYADN